MTPSAQPSAIAWYRTPIEPKLLKELHRRSDLPGFAQTLGYLGVLALTGGSVLYAAAHHAPVWAVLVLLFVHGTCANFYINAVHELGHGTVFKTKALNQFFTAVFAFPGWINHVAFEASHARHHRYTLHAPDDLEVVLPLKVMVRDFFLTGFLNLRGARNAIRGTIRIARGKYQGDWETFLFPAGSPQSRGPIRWARTLLVGHGLILAVSLWFHWWLVPVVVSCSGWYGGWLFFLCNNTQHIGLQDDVPDFRLCCRTFTLNPVVRFLYWHMNYHTEHHMYAAVPCYRLGRLHRAIRHDLPPCPAGLIATWREIAAIQKIQKENPGYQHAAPVPNPVGKAVVQAQPQAA